jgi:hypothetical protein
MLRCENHYFRIKEGYFCGLFDCVFTFTFVQTNANLDCRNPTLAKCGGEAQHLEKVRIWSPPGLPNV